MVSCITPIPKKSNAKEPSPGLEKNNRQKQLCSTKLDWREEIHERKIIVGTSLFFCYFQRAFKMIDRKTEGNRGLRRCSQMAARLLCSA